MTGAMTTNRTAILALAAAGALWGLTVPLSKLSLDWLGGGWLTVIRFAIAAPGLAYAGRRGLRAALTPRIVAAGAIGFGAVIMLQNAGIERTSVSHAALVVGAVPVMVALMAAALGHGVARPLQWTGYGVALAGQLAFYALAAGGFLAERLGRRLGTLALPYFFCTVAVAGVGGLARFLRGGAQAVWAPAGQAMTGRAA